MAAAARMGALAPRSLSTLSADTQNRGLPFVDLRGLSVGCLSPRARSEKVYGLSEWATSMSSSVCESFYQDVSGSPGG